MITIDEWTHKRRHQALTRRIEDRRDDLPDRALYLNVAGSLEVDVAGSLEVDVPGTSLDRYGKPDRFRSARPNRGRLD